MGGIWEIRENWNIVGKPTFNGFLFWSHKWWEGGLLVAEINPRMNGDQICYPGGDFFPCEQLAVGHNSQLFPSASVRLQSKTGISCPLNLKEIIRGPALLPNCIHIHRLDLLWCIDTQRVEYYGKKML